MSEMSNKCGKWLKYVGNDVDTCEMAKICRKCLMCLTIRLNKLEMPQIFGKWLKYF